MYRAGLTPSQQEAEIKGTGKERSDSALYDYLTWWREGRRDREGRQVAPPRCAAALAPLPKGPSRGRIRIPATPDDGELVEKFLLYFAERTGKTTSLVGLVRDQLLSRERLHGIPAPSRFIIGRIQKSLGRELLIAAAEGTEGLLKRALPQLVTAPPDAPNVCWFLDQWVAHTHVRMPEGTIGRPIHVHVIDAHGGGPLLGCAIGRSLNADLVARALIEAIREKPGADPILKGKPAILRCDIGRENMAKQVLDGAASLGIQVNPTTPRLPQAKGLVDVLHKILDQKFSRTLPHFAPSDVKTKPSKASPPLSFKEYEQRAREFLFGTYNHQSYTGRARRGSLSRLEIRRSVPFSAVVRKDRKSVV